LFVDEADYLYALPVMETALKFMDQIGVLGDLRLDMLNPLVIITGLKSINTTTIFPKLIETL
jgi:hypothetical protein